MKPVEGDIAASARDFLVAQGFRDPVRWIPLPGGANNRVFRLESGGRTAVLKAYFRNADDPRDRFTHERAFYTYAWGRGIRRTPEPLGWDSEGRFGLFGWIDGRKLAPGEIGEAAVVEAADFVVELNQEAAVKEAGSLPVASEACFSPAAHRETIDRRVARLVEIVPVEKVDQEAVAFVQDQLVPAWREIRVAIQPQLDAGGSPSLPAAARCVSPSDFGFHNALLPGDGRLRFIDFEYAGLDDPAKLVCDFFCQPERPVVSRWWEAFTQRLAAGVSWPGGWQERAKALLPAYRIKWCCILLNEFLPTEQRRRAFARGPERDLERRTAQLEKARTLWRTILEDAGRSPK